MKSIYAMQQYLLYKEVTENIMKKYNKKYKLITKNLLMARQIREECKANSTLKKIESKTYMVDKYFNKVRAGYVLYKGKSVDYGNVVIFSDYTGLGSQRLRVWKT